MRNDIKKACAKRLNRIEGQVRGIARMVEDDRYCIDIVTQIAAVRAALRRLEEEVLRDHVAHCVEHAIASGNKADQRRKIERRGPRRNVSGWAQVTLRYARARAPSPANGPNGSRATSASSPRLFPALVTTKKPCTKIRNT